MLLLDSEEGRTWLRTSLCWDHVTCECPWMEFWACPLAKSKWAQKSQKGRGRTVLGGPALSRCDHWHSVLGDDAPWPIPMGRLWPESSCLMAQSPYAPKNILSWAKSGRTEMWANQGTSVSSYLPTQQINRSLLSLFYSTVEFTFFLLSDFFLGGGEGITGALTLKMYKCSFQNFILRLSFSI